jgi:ATP-dependent Clp protease ATP-binding subunit ClpA
MFERFTEQAREVVGLAQDEARHFNHNHIGTEHLLLALLREDKGVAAHALNSLKVTLDEVREQIESIVGYGEEETGGQAPFTSGSKKVLELALREALELGHDHISPEHILLGLVRKPQGVAARVLSNFGIDPDKVRHEVVRSQQALEVRTRQTFPEKWASTQNNLANSYSDGVRGDGAQNLEGATHHYDQTLEAIQAFVAADTLAESKRIVESYRDVLLAEDVDEDFVGLLARYGDNVDTIRILEEDRTLLARCRREGIDATFADLEASGTPSAAVLGPIF